MNRQSVRAAFLAAFCAVCGIPMLTAQAKWNAEEMVVIPKGEFVIGEQVQSFTAKRTVNEFAIAKYETAYSLWYEIMNEAEELGYTFQNPGQEGSAGRYGRFPSEEGDGQPVTMINWYDAIVWCNAYSELKDKTPCYTYKGQPIKDSTNTAVCDLADCNFFSDGFRLPTEAEWEYPARFVPGVVKGKEYKPRSILPGNQISWNKKDAAEGEEPDAANYAWLTQNATETHRAGTAGSLFEADVSSLPGSGRANSAGIFDMTGNVLEYCWDWFANYEPQPEGKIAAGPQYGSRRVSRGGSWSEYTLFDYTADRYSYDPNECYNYMGFRVVQSR